MVIDIWNPLSTFWKMKVCPNVIILINDAQDWKLSSWLSKKIDYHILHDSVAVECLPILSLNKDLFLRGKF